ncbi:hypothetical protein IC232_03355 [Microvirga sp. BT688]|uniref:hypothetical protein n=1 Tax=Microvirga sp. TaxID=1873136 RepID=UPI001681F6F1|nr:hypothetical protein [Microvirga sp.]MBD2745726.1 hypothetical protein [Microvirga sp.]
MGNTGGRGNKHHGTIMPQYEDLPKQVESIIEELNEEAWEIKSVTPLVETYYTSAVLQNPNDMFGVTKTNAGSETITGTYTAGVLILAQRWREISDAEAAERRRQKQEKLDAEEAKRAAEAEEARRNAGPIAYERVMNMPIERNGGIMSNTWIFNGREYHTKGMAEQARMEMAMQARVDAERARDQA